MKCESPHQRVAGPVHRLIRRVLLSALLLTACDSVLGGTDCTLIGCINGLMLEYATPPAYPVSIQVFPNSFTDTPVYTYQCAAATGCVAPVIPITTKLTRATIRVTTPAGVRVTQAENIGYTVSYPNGRQCGPRCEQARVVIDMP